MSSINYTINTIGSELAAEYLSENIDSIIRSYYSTSIPYMRSTLEQKARNDVRFITIDENLFRID